MEYSELIPYRKLTRADFRASSRPAPLSNASVAAVCTGIVSVLGVRIRVLALPVAYHRVGGRRRYVLEDLGYRAVVNPACSWWKVDGHSPVEILEHEQVHFAIKELHARRLNRRIAEIMRAVESLGEAELAAIRGLLEEATKDALEMDRKFDEEMFLSWNSASRRKAWLAELEAALRQTSVFAR